ARDTVSRMNQTIPELKFTCGLRTFGHSPYVSRMKTQLFYGIAGYSTAGFGKGLQKVTDAGGHSPLYLAIQAANKDLQSLQGKSALIILSDGDKDDLDHAAALKAVKNIKGQFGPRICVYTILIGNNKAGKGLMEKLAKTCQCGFSVNADSLISSKAMGDFVRKVFLAKDSDRDGVPDTEDKCPNTPRGVKVDKDGCPLDTDGDGVPDYMDRCPGTPEGAKVNAKGCWVIENLLFDTDKYNIKPQYNSILDEVISIIRKNPDVKLQIQGHTDNIASAKYNQRLSERRANSVMNYLVEKGISKARLSAVGYGLTRPIATNLTPEGRTLNRRVQINPVR
ncbi:MAG: OmpA family protein, partial [Thermodesulfobacteriota bacterium]|nr:OmpA family protein [Thermodesulfobacteriota bacterium]